MSLYSKQYEILLNYNPNSDTNEDMNKLLKNYVNIITHIPLCTVNYGPQIKLNFQKKMYTKPLNWNNLTDYNQFFGKDQYTETYRFIGYKFDQNQVYASIQEAIADDFSKLEEKSNILIHIDDFC